AKQLRGDSMVDVIFSGSNTRKPVGQAMVELVFDNSDGSVGGPYASFAEISIRRTVGRDGTSSYFLNGTRCRRKDIIDVFLGTGLGVRGGYSVIEQGMISRVIEAKPEELRNFLEEAAGISRYKERRRETETRIRHTNENLERVNDIRQELEKQLNHLQRQAKAAEKYQELKVEERRLEAEHIALRWRQIDTARAAHRLQIGARETELEAALSALRKLENEQVALREEQTRGQQGFNTAQSAFYARSADITRIEQAIQLQEERQRALEQELNRVRLSQQDAVRMLAGDRAKLAEMDVALGQLTPSFEDSAGNEEVQAENLRRAEQAADAWQQAWDAFNREFTEVSRAEHAGQARIELLARDQGEAARRLETLGAERSRLDPASIEQQLLQERAALAAKLAETDALRVEQQGIRESVGQAREAVQTQGRLLNTKRAAWQELRGKLASLRALQEAALGRDQR
ncbi:MAG: chromosome segregation protein SMC, partial [Betaproteobacteria bacterium]|nr:chromosome segregation protein SMC [Betaproteobacteria bacterium]